MLAAVFTADLEFLSKFLGHQGASAKFLCMFCLAIKQRLPEVFQLRGLRSERFRQRSIEMLLADAAKYEEMMSKLTDSDKKKARPTITKAHTHSIVAFPMVKVDLDDCSDATTHVMLGITVWIVRIVRESYRSVEVLEAKFRGVGQSPHQLREAVDDAVDMANEYIAYLKEMLGSTMAAVES